MRYLLTPVCLVAISVVLSSTATADDDTDRADRRAEMRQKILQEFDADGDGEMSDDERATARAEMRERRGNKAKGDGAKGSKGKGKGKGAKGSKGKGKGDGQTRRGGPDGRLDPGKLFDKFDADGNGQLSRQEFKSLTKHMRANRPPRGPGGEGKRGKGPRGDGPRGADPEARRSFDRQQPLSNPGDGSGAGERGPRSRGERGPEGHRPPNPDQVFDKFDADGDDQLSRAEFKKLTKHMRQMRSEHKQRRPGGERGQLRDGRGPKGKGQGQQRPRRPRPDFDPDLAP